MYYRNSFSNQIKISLVQLQSEMAFFFSRKNEFLSIILKHNHHCAIRVTMTLKNEYEVLPTWVKKKKSLV